LPKDFQTPQALTLRFGEFVLDSSARRLSRGGEDVRLSPKAFDLLCALVARRPDVLSKADLLAAIWPDAYVIEANANPQLAALIPNFRPVFASDDYIVQRRAAEAGVGAFFMHKARHRFNLDSELVPLGMDLGPHATSDLHVVCAKSALGVARVRAVAELLKDELLHAEKLSKAAFG
jgi:DNA-binding transcriptional LysR family regulator